MAKTQIFEDFTAFLAREDKSINGVTAGFGKEHGIDLEKDDGNMGCWNCVDCFYCVDCMRCKACVHCKHCSHCKHCRDFRYGVNHG
jgi:hypothetical protein